MNETALLAAYLCPSGTPGVMLDVGAHHGGAAEPFLAAGWTVHAFEPDARNRRHLQALATRYPRLHIDVRAVSDRVQEGLPFYTSPVSDGISGLSRFHPTHAETACVDTTDLASFCAKWGLTCIRFLKIDTEGYDLHVLRGYDWQKGRPEAVLCEFEDRKTLPLGYSFKDLGRFLVDRGYEVLVSEWLPVVEYGREHRWRRFATFPCELVECGAWGNFLAFRDGIDWVGIVNALASVRDPSLPIATDDLVAMRADLAYMRGSASWRLTSPLRRVMGWVKSRTWRRGATRFEGLAEPVGHTPQVVDDQSHNFPLPGVRRVDNEHVKTVSQAEFNKRTVSSMIREAYRRRLPERLRLTVWTLRQKTWPAIRAIPPAIARDFRHEYSACRLRTLKGRYVGQRCFIMGNGPSLNQMDLGLLRHEYTWATNRCYLLFDRISWRPSFYAAVDKRVVPDIATEIDGLARTLPQTSFFLPIGFREQGVLRMRGRNTYWYIEKPIDESVLPYGMFTRDASESVSAVRTVTVACLQLAVYLGFNPIYLIGCDTSYAVPATVRQEGADADKLVSTRDDDPNHFDPRYFGTGRKWHEPHVDRMLFHYAQANCACRELGVDVFNATVGGRLEEFPRVDYESLF